MQAIRAGFEYQGQKCSALSRCYVPKSKWTEFERILKEEVKKITVGPPTEWQHFVGPVIGRPAFEKITGMITKGKEAGGEIITGGTWDDSKGFYVQPTVILTKDPKSVTMTEEIFGPVITVYVYDDAEEGAWEKTCQLIDTTTEYALTGAVFSADRTELIKASNYLRNSAGNFYLNDKCTGAVVSRARECLLRQSQTESFLSLVRAFQVGQQPFGGARASGTNDKSGSMSIFYRFASARSIKENFGSVEDFAYPSNSV
jgi:1-pyrroline-5-carboxylate dehydrogenase